MRTLKKFGVLMVAVFALSVVGVASASAATFTSSEEGELQGHALTTQVFETNAGPVNCPVAEVTGFVIAKESTEQHVTVHYKNCKAFSGLVSVEISTATYLFTSNGTVHILKPIVINVPLGGCTQTVPAQTVSSVSFSGNSEGNLVESSAVTGIEYETSGGLCGEPGSDGTYVGDNEVELVKGGTLGFDA
jgi:hypothetical protein